jgi:hypothetical protein
MLLAMDYIQQAQQLDLQTGLFPAFPPGGFGRIFVRLHEPGRQRPLTHFGLHCPADEQDLTLSFQQDRRRDFWIKEVNPTAGRAHRPDSSVRLSLFDRCAATSAVADRLPLGH